MTRRLSNPHRYGRVDEDRFTSGRVDFRLHRPDDDGNPAPLATVGSFRPEHRHVRKGHTHRPHLFRGDDGTVPAIGLNLNVVTFIVDNRDRIDRFVLVKPGARDRRGNPPPPLYTLDVGDLLHAMRNGDTWTGTKDVDAQEFVPLRLWAVHPDPDAPPPPTPLYRVLTEPEPDPQLPLF